MNLAIMKNPISRIATSRFGELIVDQPRACRSNGRLLVHGSFQKSGASILTPNAMDLI